MIFDVPQIVRGETPLALEPLEVARGEALCLLGANGAGKTTLLKQLLGLLERPGAEVCFMGHRVSHKDRHMKLLVGYMPQESRPLNHLTCAEAVYYTARLRGLTRLDARRAQTRQLHHWELGHLADRDNAALSGGERRLLRMAVTTVGDPQVLVLDEPCAYLDRHRADLIIAALRSLPHDPTIVMVTHSFGEALALGDRLAIMEAGLITKVAAVDRDDRLTATNLNVRVWLQDPNGISHVSAHGLRQEAPGVWSGTLDCVRAGDLLTPAFLACVGNIEIGAPDSSAAWASPATAPQA